ncbi:hypothetical protein SHM_17220 [Spiroplasma ixodetis]|uniref:Spiroplasmavirus-related protein n=1 Tax=Spiroplasma ixodetis TaxID=2141 RepID=A0ABM8BWD4_9MOLU|nr:hypothetical protein SHM_17220 [Spiroplasma ixodetis]
MKWIKLCYFNFLPKFYKRCILLNKNDEIITGEIFNNWNMNINRAFCSINVKWFKKWKE